MLKRFLLGASLALMVFGCGNSLDALSVGSAYGGPSGASSRFVGQVRGVDPLANAQVQVFDVDGRPLLRAPLATNIAGGFFLDRVFSTPFRVAAETAGGTYSRYCESPRSGWIHLNALTTLIDRYRIANPGVSPKDAETAVRQALGIEGALDHDFGHQPVAHTNFR